MYFFGSGNYRFTALCNLTKLYKSVIAVITLSFGFLLQACKKDEICHGILGLAKINCSAIQ